MALKYSVFDTESAECNIVFSLGTIPITENWMTINKSKVQCRVTGKAPMQPRYWISYSIHKQVEQVLCSTWHWLKHRYPVCFLLLMLFFTTSTFARSTTALLQSDCAPSSMLCTTYPTLPNPNNQYTNLTRGIQINVLHKNNRNSVRCIGPARQNSTLHPY